MEEKKATANGRTVKLQARPGTNRYVFAVLFYKILNILMHYIHRKHVNALI